MWRELLPHLPVFLAVVRRAGFAAAANELGMSPSAVSHAIRVIEMRLGSPLFARTTRSVALTEAGRRLNDSIAAALQEVQTALEQVQSEQGHISGLLRLNVPSIALPMGGGAGGAGGARRRPRRGGGGPAGAARADGGAAGGGAGGR